MSKFNGPLQINGPLHLRVQRVLKFAGNLAEFFSEKSILSKVAKELPRFSDLLHYPDKRPPAQGDTYRKCNSIKKSEKDSAPYLEPACVNLSRTGYAVVKGNHEDSSFMLTVFATSLVRTHKHEGNLSFTLFFDGIEWLIDPSFYSHEYEAPIPAYLRSASAHNALALSDCEYSIDPGKAKLEAKSKDSKFTIKGSHSAYNDVDVTREISGNIDSLALSFVDQARAKTKVADKNDLSLMFHCGDLVEVEVDGGIAVLSHPNSSYKLEITLPNDPVVVHYNKVDTLPIRGVTGLGFMKIAPINTIECNIPFNSPERWRLRAISNEDGL